MYEVYYNIQALGSSCTPLVLSAWKRSFALLYFGGGGTSYFLDLMPHCLIGRSNMLLPGYGRTVSYVVAGK